MSISRWWIVAAVLFLVIGYGMNFFARLRPVPRAEIPPRVVSRELAAPSVVTTVPPSPVPMARPTARPFEADEPIIARVEPLEASPGPGNALLPNSGGAEESEAIATPAPRPDADSRRMPYADEP